MDVHLCPSLSSCGIVSDVYVMRFNVVQRESLVVGTTAHLSVQASAHLTGAHKDDGLPQLFTLREDHVLEDGDLVGWVGHRL